MTVYIAESDSEGRSAVMETSEFASASAEAGVDVIEFISYVANSADVKIWSAGSGLLLESGVAPATMVWRVSRMPRGWQYPDMHRVRTVEVHAVLEGTLTVRLDDGEHALKAGDFLVLKGVDHAWRAGDEGALLSTVQLGIQK